MVRKKRAGGKAVKKAVHATTKKINLALRNFILFLILFILSLILYNASSNVLFINFFAIILIITGFVSLAFLIVLLVLWILKLSRK